MAKLAPLGCPFFFFWTTDQKLESWEPVHCRSLFQQVHLDGLTSVSHICRISVATYKHSDVRQRGTLCERQNCAEKFYAGEHVTGLQNFFAGLALISAHSFTLKITGPLHPLRIPNLAEEKCPFSLSLYRALRAHWDGQAFWRSTDVLQKWRTDSPLILHLVMKYFDRMITKRDYKMDGEHAPAIIVDIFTWFRIFFLFLAAPRAQTLHDKTNSQISSPSYYYHFFFSRWQHSIKNLHFILTLEFWYGDKHLSH